VARAKIASHSSAKPKPAARAIFGSKLVSVIPGSVLTSSTYSFWPSVTSKSTRTAPLVSSARAARSAKFNTPV